jgi:AcrR family transcriptional regulator
MLDAAVRVFSQRGFHAASMDEIADRADISKPMLYAYLGTKEELFIACLHREGTRMMEAIIGAIRPGAPLDEQLWRGLGAFFGFVGVHRDGWAMLYRQARGEPPFARELTAMRSRIVDVVAGMLAEGVRDAGGNTAPEAGPAADPRVLAYALVGASESTADWLVDHPEADPAELATGLMSIIWTGAQRSLAGERWRPPAR